jgi:heme/copper-type cytochrome/quinol oxidase subunit 4
MFEVMKYFFRKKDKKAVEWELGKIILAIVILALMVFAIILLVKGKGGETLAAVRKLLRLGRTA